MFKNINLSNCCSVRLLQTLHAKTPTMPRAAQLPEPRSLVLKPPATPGCRLMRGADIYIYIYIYIYMSSVLWWLNLVRLYSLYQILCPKRRIESYSILGTTVSPNKILLMRCWPRRTYPCLDPTPLKGIGLGGLAALDRWRGEVECVRCPANKAPWQHGAQHIANPKSKPLNPKP